MLAVVVFAGFIAALGAPALVRAARGRAGWVIALLPAALCAYFVWQAPAVLAGRPVVLDWPWAPSLGLALSFRLDALGLLFALLISGIGALVAVYAGRYLQGRPDVGRFYLYLLLFMASMLGVVLADNLLGLFVFWELTSVTSYLLIGFDHDRPESRAGALKALLITGGGGLAMLAGFIVLGQMAGTPAISALPAGLSADPGYFPALVLILVGAFAKSAQWPLHIWLPDAMQAPTPVSAYLHSATMVKAGVYLLARLSPALGDTPEWFYAVSGFGLVTMLTGALLALKQTDLKAILAYSTIGWLGVLVMLLGWGTSEALAAAMVGVVVHALYKGALFLLAGGIDHEAGTRDIRQLGGLRRAMPISAALTGITAFSMAGLPLLAGFVAKELLLEAALHSGYPPVLGGLAATAVVLAGLVNMAVALRLFHGIFWGPPRAAAGRHVHDPPLAMLLGPGLLAALTLLVGLWPAALNALVQGAAAAAAGAEVPVKLALWHGLSLPLLLSAVAIAAGVGLYLVYGRVAALLDRVLRFSFNHLYDGAVAGLLWLAQATTARLQNGRLRYYLATILVTAVGLVGYALVGRGGGLVDLSRVQVAPPTLYEVLLGSVIIVVAVMVTRARGRLTAIAGMGVIGAMVALFFVLFSAPDLALTQLLIETLMVVVFLLAFHFLPRFFEEGTPRSGRIRDILVSLAMGLLAAGLVMLTTILPQPADDIAGYFIENSYLLAHGRDIVNVILVDFRGADTLGEITVLAIAATGVYALLRSKR